MFVKKLKLKFNLKKMNNENNLLKFKRLLN